MSIKCNYVVNCSGGSIPNLYSRFGIRYLTFRWFDSKTCTIFDHQCKTLKQIFKFIDGALTKGNAVLVHSIYGDSRAPLAVAGYLMLKFHWSVTKCLEFIAFKRPETNPKPYFIRQLKRCQTYLKIKENDSLNVEDRWCNKENTNEELVIRNTFLNSHFIKASDSNTFESAISKHTNKIKHNNTFKKQVQWATKLTEHSDSPQNNKHNNPTETTLKASGINLGSTYSGHLMGNNSTWNDTNSTAPSHNTNNNIMSTNVSYQSMIKNKPVSILKQKPLVGQRPSTPSSSILSPNTKRTRDINNLDSNSSQNSPLLNHTNPITNVISHNSNNKTVPPIKGLQNIINNNTNSQDDQNESSMSSNLSNDPNINNNVTNTGTNGSSTRNSNRSNNIHTNTHAQKLKHELNLAKQFSAMQIKNNNKNNINPNLQSFRAYKDSTNVNRYNTNANSSTERDSSRNSPNNGSSARVLWSNTKPRTTSKRQSWVPGTSQDSTKRLYNRPGNNFHSTMTSFRNSDSKILQGLKVVGKSNGNDSNSAIRATKKISSLSHTNDQTTSQFSRYSYVVLFYFLF